MSMRISLCKAAISVKYTSELWEIFEATIYSKSNFTPHFSSFVTRIIHPFTYLHIFQLRRSCQNYRQCSSAFLQGET